jgi:hypothetical protein
VRASIICGEEITENSTAKTKTKVPVKRVRFNSICLFGFGPVIKLPLIFIIYEFIVE